MQEPDSLHEKASSHYLQGEVDAALAVWRKLLELRPDDERALEGVRLCEQMAGSLAESVCTEGRSPFAVADAPAEASAGAEGGGGPARLGLDEDFAELDAALEFQDARPPEAPAAPTPDEDLLDLSSLGGDLDDLDGLAEELDDAESAGDPPKSGGSPFDFLDDEPLAASDGAPRAAPADPATAPADAAGDGDVRWEWNLGDDKAPAPPAAAPAPAQAAVAVEDAADEGGPREAPATVELRRRINELLASALVSMESGRAGEALCILDRILILDDENEAAQSLRERLREQGVTAPGSAPAPAPGPDVFDHGAVDLDEGDGGEIGLGAEPGSSPEQSVDGPDAPGDDAGEPTVEEEAGPQRRPRRQRPSATPPAAAKPQRRHQWILVGAGVLLAAGVALASLWSQFFTASPGPPEVDPAVQAVAEVEAALGRPGERPPPQPADAGPPAPAPTDAAAAETDLATTIQRGATAMSEARYADAVLAFDEAKRLRPGDPNIAAWLAEAGKRFKEQRAVEEQWERARKAFTDGNYTAALRMFYRLPAGDDADRLDRYKVNGWFNLGLGSLRTGDCATAASNFDEAAAIRPDDPGVRQGRALARECRRGARGEEYARALRQISQRGLDD